MSKVHSILRQQSEAPVSGKTWRLKTADGRTYGPVSLSELCDWANQGRVMAGDLLSKDGIQWVPAESFSELKMEWEARLPNGKICGPLNVLAVPFLVKNGFLPPDTVLVNRNSGKSLNVRDLLKAKAPASAPTAAPLPAPTAAPLPAPTPVPSQPVPVPTSEAPSVPLLQEAHVQKSIDRIQGNKSAPPAAEDLSAQVSESLMTDEAAQNLDPKARQHLIREGIRQMHRDAERLKARLEQAEKETAAARKESEDQRKRFTTREQEFLDETSQLRSELKAARDEMFKASREAADPGPGPDASAKLTQKKEQDLNRVLDETRRKAESDAAQLYKIRSQLDETRNQKAELQARALHEENKLKLRIEELEKQVHVLSADLQTQKAQSQFLEKESLLKVERLQGQVNQARDKYEQAAAELERLKKEVETQRSLAVDLEKAGSERETALARDLRAARSAIGKLENDQAVLRKQYETLKVQGGHRETELLDKIELLNNEARGSAATLDNLRKELAAFTEERMKMERNLRNATADVERANAELADTRSDFAMLENKVNQQAEMLAAMEQERDKDDAAYREALGKADRQAEELSREAVRLRDENNSLSGRLTAADQEADALRKTVGDLRGQADEMDRQLQARVAELEGVRRETEKARQDLAVAVSSREQIQGAASTRESDLARRLEEARAQDAARATALQAAVEETARLRSSLEGEQARSRKAETEANEIRTRLENELAGARRALDEVRAELQSKTERVESLAHQGTRTQQDLARRIAELETELKTAAAQLVDARQAAAAEKEQGEQQRRTLEQELAATREKLNAASLELAKQEADLKTRLSGAQQALTSETAALKTSLAETAAREADLRKERDDLRLQAERAQKDLDTREKQYKELEDRGGRREKELERTLREREKTAAAERAQFERREHALLKQLEKAAPEAAAAEAQRASAGAGRPALSTVTRAALAAACLAALVGAGWWLFGPATHRSGPDGADETPDAHAPPTFPPKVEEPPEVATLMSTGQPSLEKKPVKLPALRIDHARVTYNNDNTACSIVFDFGLFMAMTNLSADAMTTLKAAAQPLRSLMKDFDLIIEGHTDTVPVSAVASYVDNMMLGKARARVVMDMLKGFGLPAESMLDLSLGENDPPYPNDNEDLRKKNRTVVLKLRPKQK